MQQSPPTQTHPALQPSAEPSATWVISDGRAGNHLQALALAEHLQRAGQEIHLSPKSPWSALAPRVLPFAYRAFDSPIQDVLKGRKPPPQLVIGCGRQAALATRLLHQKGAFAIQILNPRLDTRHWDLVITPEHDDLAGPNIVTVMGSIHRITADRLVQIAATPHAFQSMPSPRVALLIGGDTHNQTFDLAAFPALLDEVKTFVKQHDGSLLISNSRRTPLSISEQLREWVDDVPSYVWTGEADAKRLGEFPFNPYAHYLALSDVIICSADSVSMLSEAAATTAKLLVFGEINGNGAPQKFARQLISIGRALPWSASVDLNVEQVPLETNRDLVTRLRRAATL